MRARAVHSPSSSCSAHCQASLVSSDETLMCHSYCVTAQTTRFGRSTARCGDMQSGMRMPDSACPIAPHRASQTLVRLLLQYGLGNFFAQPQVAPRTQYMNGKILCQHCSIEFDRHLAQLQRTAACPRVRAFERRLQLCRVAAPTTPSRSPEPQSEFWTCTSPASMRVLHELCARLCTARLERRLPCQAKQQHFGAPFEARKFKLVWRAVPLHLCSCGVA